MPKQSEGAKHFREFLQAASVAGKELILHRGISREGGQDSSTYYDSIEALAEYVCSWEPSEVVDHVTDRELMAKIDAAYMLGLAVGLQVNPTAVLGASKSVAPKGGTR